MSWLTDSWVFDNTGRAAQLFVDHVWLSVLPIVLGFLLALPIGWYANRRRRLRGVLLSTGSVLYTIPSLAFFLLLPGILGTDFLDPTNVVIALTIYALAIMVRSAADGFESVPASVLDAATAAGFSRRELAFRVELPLAGPVLLAGLRVVSVSTVSMVSVGALVGVENLGILFTEGIRGSGDPGQIAAGIVLVVVLALVLDAVLVLAGRALMPWSRAASGAGGAR